MNINELTENKVSEVKERVLVEGSNHYPKVQQVEEEIEVNKDLENAALKIKAESKIEELERKSKELIEILEKFSKKVPPMIERLEIINEGLKLENFKNTLTSINNYSCEISKIIRAIKENNSFINKEIINIAKKEIILISENSNKAIDKRKTFYSSMDKVVLVVMVSLFIFNLGMRYFYKKQINKTSYEINRVHNVLMSEKKYWIDENNYEIYVKNIKSKK